MNSREPTPKSTQSKRTHFFRNDAMGDADTVALSNLIKSGSVSKQEVVASAIDRARDMNPVCNAFVSESFDRAMSESMRPDDKVFSGIPTFIKDTDDIIGSPTFVGSAATSNKIAVSDSDLVRQFKTLGFVNLGKSSTPEFGLTGTTEPVKFGPSRNPWNTDHSTGGSSGGAAALVASGVVSIAHANDGAGSIRIPASCCGLVGLKPTRNRLAQIEASKTMPVNILHQGIVTRSVRDTAAFYTAIENAGLANPALPMIDSVDHPIQRRLRIALLTETSGTPVDGDCVDAAQKAAKICESLGHHVDSIAHPFDPQVMEDFFLYWSWMAFMVKNFGKLLVDRSFNKSKLEPLANGLSSEFFKNIHRFPFIVCRLKKFARTYAKFFNKYDVLLTPTLGHAPPKLGYLSTELDFDTAFDRLKTFLPFTPYQNISGAPAITLPITNNAAGLPVGVQFASKYGEDRLLLELALELEKANPWKKITD